MIGFSSSGTAVPDGFVSSRAVGGFTENGVTSFGTPVLLKQGTAPYQILDSMGRNRWGDYSATTIDPNNPTRFWTIQEWSSGTDFEFIMDGGDWSTQITELTVSLIIGASPGDPPRPAGGAETDDPAGAPKSGHYGAERPQDYGRDVELGRIRLREFTDHVLIGDTPENVGDMQTQRFSALLDAVLQVGSNSFTLSGIPAELNLKATLTFIDGDSNVFDTALQLLDVDLSGIPGLPFDALVRLDPNRPSSGRSVVTESSPGRFAVNSYLDLFTELTIDTDRDGMPDQSLLADRNSRLLLAPTLGADFDEDGDVDGDDLVKWRTGFGMSGTATHLQGDADGDLDVDGADFLVWQRQMGSTSAVAANGTVPEPSTWALVSLAVVGGTLARRRRGAQRVSKLTARETRHQRTVFETLPESLKTGCSQGALQPCGSWNACHRRQDIAGHDGMNATASGVLGPNGAGDADGDFDADGADMLVLQRQLGRRIASLGGGIGRIPEPGSALLAISGLAMTASIARK